MPLDTNLNVPPYYDDYDPEKQFYQILFTPGRAVQVRELNQLQTILQRQIERFGDNILKTGTIIDGCNFSFYNYYPYIKILDNQIDNEPVVPPNYVGKFAKNSANLTAFIINEVEGFESQDPDLNTLYLKYVNSGTDANAIAFSPNEILTIYDTTNSLWKVNIDNGGSGFSNSDSVVFVSALIVDLSSSNNFTNGEVITQSTTGSKATIISTNNTIVPGNLVLSIKPLIADLSNTSGNSSVWTFDTGYTITGNTTSATANVVDIMGFGANASVITDSVGQIQQAVLSNGGQNYLVAPYVSIKPSSNTSAINDLNLSAQNYLCQVTVASVSNSVGSGYAFGVSDGVIYQKGYFLTVDEQIEIVSKYTPYPDQLSVGFSSLESTINSFSDSSLYDNANTTNVNAPGADRLKITPTLTVVTKNVADANDKFFPIVEFSNGNPYKQNQYTNYNIIQNEINQRTFETSGNFVLDPFLLSSKSPSNNAYESNTFTLVVDPGHAYINGNRIKTYNNYYFDIDKGTDTSVIDNHFSINYGNYLQVIELGGIFQFNTGDVISLRDTVKKFVSNTANITGAITGAGSEIGKARIRSLEYVSGTPGTPTGTYNLYLFDIQMNSGKNFKDVASVFYNGSSRKAVADVNKVYDATLNANVAALQGTSNNSLLFTVPNESLKNANAVAFTYKNIANTVANNSGIMSVSLTATQETLPYNAPLSATELSSLIAIPLANAISNVVVSSGVTLSSTGNTATGSGFSVLFAGDYLQFVDGANVEIKQVRSVTNSSSIVLDSNSNFSSSSANAYLAFPQNVPVILAGRNLRSANVDITDKVLSVNLGTTLASNTNFNIIYNVRSTAVQSTKTVNRNLYTRINLANSSANVVGPWVVGVSDVFRLKGVWLNSNVSSIDETATNVTNEFYIDHNQNVNYYGQSYLYLKPTSKLVLANTNALLVKFDTFTTSNPGYYTVASYNIDDSSNNIVNANTTINIAEVPEVYGDRSQYYDLINCFDFRPVAANTANITSTLSGSTINPVEISYTNRFGNTANPANILYFPTPSSNVFATVERYIGRIDRVVVNDKGDIKAIRGKASDVNQKAPPAPPNSITLGTVWVPPYPSIPAVKSANLISIYDKGIANEKYVYTREQNHTIGIYQDLNPDTAQDTQTQGFTMTDIANLERRIEVLEYYNSLTQLEKTVSGITIPSSVDAQVNRFKYGFFVDDFSNTNFSDLANPEYKAAISNSYVVPSQNSVSIAYGYNSAHANTVTDSQGNILTFSFDAMTLVSQLNATDGAVVVPPPVVVTPTPVTPTPPAPVANTTPPPVPTPPPPPVYTAPPVLVDRIFNDLAVSPIANKSRVIKIYQTRFGFQTEAVPAYTSQGTPPVNYTGSGTITTGPIVTTPVTTKTSNVLNGWDTIRL